MVMSYECLNIQSQYSMLFASLAWLGSIKFVILKVNGYTSHRLCSSLDAFLLFMPIYA